VRASTATCARSATCKMQPVKRSACKPVVVPRLRPPIEPLGRNGVRVQFSDVGVDALLRALGAAEQRYGLRVTQLNLNRRQPGLVSARISLER